MDVAGIAAQSTDALTIRSTDDHKIWINPSKGAGHNNPLVQAGDLGLIYTAGPIDTGALVIGQWSNSARGIRINSAGNVGIGRNPATNALEVEGNASKTTAGDWLANSDIRIKTDVQDIKNPLGVINQLHPVKFRYTKDYMTKHESIEDRYYYNFIAQEFQEVFPDSVKDDGEGYLQMDTHNVRPFLVAAVQELSKAVKVQAEEIEWLKQEVSKLKGNFLY